jgi:hypothetical protein
MRIISLRLEKEIYFSVFLMKESNHMVIEDRMVLFHFEEFLELFHKVPMLMLDRSVHPFQDHMFE